MTNLVTKATANILPAGSMAPVAEMADGKYGVRILEITDDGYLKTEYPDGFVRDHDTKDLSDFMVKISNNFRARYGRADVKFLNTPALEAGAIIEVEVGNGA